MFLNKRSPVFYGKGLFFLSITVALLMSVAAFGAGDSRMALIDSAAEFLGLHDSASVVPSGLSVGSTEETQNTGPTSASNAFLPPTVLSVGDIAFSGYIANGAVPDQFSFVLLKTVEVGTVIKFTDFGWRSNTSSFNSGLAFEEEITLTCVAMAAGTEVVFDGTNATKAGGGTAGSIVYSTGGQFQSPLNLSSGGDQLFAYQGTFASPTFITGIHMNVYTTAIFDPNNTDDANWDGVLAANDPNINGSSSTKPLTLTTGTDAIWIGTFGDSTSEKDNARFNCGPNVSTVALARAALNNKANWTATDANPPGFTLPSGCSFGAATPTATNTPTNTPTNTATNTPTNTATNTATNTPTPTPTIPPSIAGTVTYANAIGSPTPRFVSNVLMSGAGSTPVFALTTFPGGTYSLSGFGAGGYTVTPSKSTGQNSITSFDAALVALHVAGPPNAQLNATQLSVADVSGNSSVTSFDAGMIAKFVAGPPYAAPGIGQTSTWKFIPVSRTYLSVPPSVTGQDFSALLMGEVSGNWNNTGARPINGSGPKRSVTVNLPSLATSADKELLIPVTIQGAANKGIISYEFDLRYDPSVIQPQADPVDLTETVSRGLSFVTNCKEPGLLRVVVYGPMALDSNGLLLNLRFNVIGSPGMVSSLAWERIMFNEGNPGTTATDGRVEIGW